MPTRATEVSIADLIACSTCFGHHYAHHQGLKSIQWWLPVVFRAVASPHQFFTFLTNFKISNFNKEHMSSLRMI